MRFFKGIDFNKLINYEYKAPFIPELVNLNNNIKIYIFHNLERDL